MRFLYSVLRFVPEPIRGEFVNIGAIVGSDESSQWELRLVEGQRRARALDTAGVLASVWSHIQDIGSALDAFADAVEGDDQSAEPVSEEWLIDLYERSQNVLQLSSPAPLSAATVSEAFDIVFDEFIVEPESRRYDFAKKHTALASVRAAFRELGLKKNKSVFDRCAVKSRHHSRVFDFTVANGEAVQLTQTWSFQVPDQERIAEDVKAWAWTVRDLREQGGHVLVGKRHVAVPADVDVEVVYVPPTDDVGRKSLDEAVSAFESVHASAVEHGRAVEVARRAHALLEKRI